MTVVTCQVRYAMRERLITTLAIGVVTFVAACGTEAPPIDPIESGVGSSPPATVSPDPTPSPLSAAFPDGLSDQTLTVDGVERRYRVYVPANLTTPTALVVVLHGGGGDGAAVADDPRDPLRVFSDVASREGAIAVYPEGLPALDRAGDRAGWDDCRADNRVASGADDTAFLVSLITLINDAYGLDPSRTLVAGTSNGAQMAQTLAFTRPDVIGALAISAGNLPAVPKAGPCSTGPDRPVPILMTHGTADEMMPFAGGCVANLTGECNRGTVVSAEVTLDRWLAINGVTSNDPSPEVIDLATDDSGPANRFDFVGTAPVQWWRLDGAGHPIPSQLPGLTSPRVVGPRNTDVEFAEIAWDFFTQTRP